MAGHYYRRRYYRPYRYGDRPYYRPYGYYGYATGGPTMVMGGAGATETGLAQEHRS
jgi:hypothetical protein